MDMIIRLYYRLANLYLRRRYRFRHVFSVEDVRFYVPADAATRRQVFDDCCTAFAYGEAVYGRSKHALTSAVVKHELEHVKQFRWAPAYMSFDYEWQLQTRGYWKNRYEVSARRAERRVTKFRRRHVR